MPDFKNSHVERGIFYEVYQTENEAAKQRIISEIDGDQSPKDIIKQFIIQTTEQIEIFSRMIQKLASN